MGQATINLIAMVFAEQVYLVKTRRLVDFIVLLLKAMLLNSSIYLLCREHTVARCLRPFSSLQKQSLSLLFS